MVRNQSFKLKITEFGNPILRSRAEKLSPAEIKSKKTKKIISEMEEILLAKNLGVGLAAPQVGLNKQIAIIRIRSSKHRPDATNYDLNMINPEIIEFYGRKQQMWEGCISGGSSKRSLFARALRYKKLRLKYFDENGKRKNGVFDGIQAQIIQHELDHLNGILFVDRVKDTKSYTTYNEYIKISKQSNKKTNQKQL